jgi:hypothetical protein
MNANQMTTLLHELINNHHFVRHVYQYPNDDLLTRYDGLLVQTNDGSAFRISVTKTHDGQESG